MTVRRLMGLTAALALITPAVVVTLAQPPQTMPAAGAADVLLGAALHQADVDGDVRGAIATYERVLADTTASRRTQAEALLGLGQAHERLGRTDDARAPYERLRTEFGDTRPATEAGRRLAALAPPTPGSQATPVSDRVVWAGTEFIDQARISPDGRFFVATDWNGGSLMLHDLQAGSARVLADSGQWTIGNAVSAAFSRDGRQVAYDWHMNRGDGQALIVDVNGTAEPRRVRANADVDTFRPKDWSPDGRTLVGLGFRADGSQQIAMVGIDDGSYRGLKTVGWRGPRTVLLSPDGRHIAYDLPASDDEDQRDVFVMAVDASVETRLAHPAHDVFLGWSPDGGHLLFASDRHTTVGVWAVRMTDGKPQGEATLVKPNVGAVSSLGVTSSGALHLVKDASTLTLQVAPIDLGTGRLAGPPAAENFGVEYPTWSPDGNTLTYAHTGANGIRVLAIRSMDTGAIRHVRPALHYFRHTPMAPDGQSAVTFGRDRNGRTGIYRIDLRDGRTTLLVPDAEISPVQLSPDGRKLYHNVGYWTRTQQPARFTERDLTSGDTREVFRPAEGSTGISRLSADGQHLATIDFDSASRASHVVIRPVAGGSARTLLTVNHPDSLAAFGGLNWAPGGRAVTVVKTLDGTPARKELWLVPVDGSQARRLDIDINGWHLGPDSVRLSPDGRRITFLTGRAAQEVWRIESVIPALGARTGR